MQRIKLSHAGRWLPWLFFGAVYALLIGFYAAHGMHYLDADISLDLVMAQHLNREGSLLSDTLWYTSELRLFHATNVYQLGMLLFPQNWHLVRLLAVAFLLPAVSLSFMYALRSAGLKASSVWGAAVILLPVSVYYLFTLTYGLFYACFSAAAFLQLGLCLRLAKGKPDNGKRFLPRLLLLMIVDIAFGLSGVRMLMLSAAPLGIVAVLTLLTAFFDRRSQHDVLHSWPGRLLGIAALHTGFILIGTLVNRLVLARILHFADQAAAKPLTIPTVDAFLRQLTQLCGFLGGAETSLSGSGRYLPMVLLACAAVLLIFRRRLAQDEVQESFLLLPAAAVLLGMLVNVVFDTEGSYTSAYFITGLMLLAASGFILLERLKLPHGIAAAGSALLAAMFLALSLSTLSADMLPKADSHPVEKAAEWLLEQGYTEGYAEWNEAGPLVQASSGELEVWMIHDFRREGDVIWEWGQSMDHGSRRPAGKTFVLLGTNYDGYLKLVEKMGRAPDWCILQPIRNVFNQGRDYYSIYLADSWEQLFGTHTEE